jgi:hypothetical protein
VGVGTGGSVGSGTVVAVSWAAPPQATKTTPIASKRHMDFIILISSEINNFFTGSI